MKVQLLSCFTYHRLPITLRTCLMTWCDLPVTDCINPPASRLVTCCLPAHLSAFLPFSHIQAKISTSKTMNEKYIDGHPYRNPRKALEHPRTDRRARHSIRFPTHDPTSSPSSQSAQNRACADEISRLWASGGLDALPGDPPPQSLTISLRSLVFFSIACICLFLVSVGYLAIRTCFYSEVDYAAVFAVVIFYTAPKIVNPI